MGQMQCASVFYQVPEPDKWEDGCDRYIVNGMYIDHHCIGDGCMCWERGRRKEDLPLVKAALAAKKKARVQEREIEPYEEAMSDWNLPDRSDLPVWLLIVLGLIMIAICTWGSWAFWVSVAPESTKNPAIEEQGS